MKAILFNKVGMLSMATSRRLPSPTTYCPTLFSRCQPSLVVSKACLSTGGMKLAHESNPSTIIRRLENYKPAMWNFQYIQSVNNHYAGNKYMERFDELKEEMEKDLMMMINEGSIQELDTKLELLDNLENLGVSYHFKDEIRQILWSIHNNQSGSSAATSGDSLYYAALKFRLFRQHSFHISQDILNNFKYEHGNLKQSICNDTKRVTHLKNYVDHNQYCGTEDNKLMVALVLHALELPRHWMMPRLEMENIFPKRGYHTLESCY